jgi:hypothetical protein
MGKDGDGFCHRTWIYILRFSFPRRRRLLQQEDGESQNTFSWTGWMDWMDDGMDGWKKLHNHDVLYYM